MSSKARKTSVRKRFLRTAILVATSAVLLSSGMVLTLREPAPPPAPTFSEQALADAYADTEKLRSAAAALAEDAPAELAGTPQLGSTVSLLTVQAQALFRPLPEVPDKAAARPASSPAPTEVPDPVTQPAPASLPALLTELAASAFERLSDAQEADGGTARLLAAAGTGQLLEAAALAAESGVPVPGLGIPGPGLSTETLPSPPAACPGPASTELHAALTAVLESERQSEYGYQVAVPRLTGDAADLAAAALIRHGELADAAAAFLAAHCLGVPPPAPGYALDREFLADGTAGLSALEAGALPVYGDLVAFSDRATREWAISSLKETAQRAAGWGADPDPLPGLVLDSSALPPPAGADGAEKTGAGPGSGPGAGPGER